MLDKLKKLHREGSSGFTIIEVMVVLTIAALIMLIVFLAIPQLNRNQRNTRRKDITNRIKSEVENYASNNNSSLPTADANASTGFNSGAGGFYTRYISALNFKDPTTNNITLSAWTTDANVNTIGTIYYVTGRVCSGETSAAGTATNYIVMTQLEGNATYCLDNH